MFWKTIAPNGVDNDVSLHRDNLTQLSAQECASELNGFFSSVFTLEDHSNVPAVPETDFRFMEPIDISLDGIMGPISNLKLSTSCGIVNINSKVLRNTSLISGQILLHIFRQSLSSGQLPMDWKIAKVIPVFKNGSRQLAENYRPISLTCICCKLLEHIISSHLYSHLESNHFFFQ